MVRPMDAGQLRRCRRLGDSVLRLVNDGGRKQRGSGFGTWSARSRAALSEEMFRFRPYKARACEGFELRARMRMIWHG